MFTIFEDFRRKFNPKRPKAQIEIEKKNVFFFAFISSLAGSYITTRQNVLSRLTDGYVYTSFDFSKFIDIKTCVHLFCEYSI